MAFLAYWVNRGVNSSVVLIHKTKDLKVNIRGYENTRMFSRELIQIEEMIEEYFENLVMPDHPTIYDYLVLGLRDKDVIATFNWDPFLYYAHKRNRGVAPLPEIRFLHGCVVFATCHDHDILACPYEICPECNKVVKRARLFLPDSDKDYTKDAVIMREWGAVCDALNNAFHVTIFGYSGPATDYNARELLRERWQKAPFPDHSDVEIIDIKDENELRECWSEFIRYDHAMVRRDFWSSTIALYPRRTAEYKLGASVHGKPAEYIGPFHTDSLHDLQTWFCKLAEPETNHS